MERDGETGRTSDLAGHPPAARRCRREHLVGVLAERSRLITEVIEYKRRNHMAVVDRGREDEMLARIGDLAAADGLDPRIARQVLRAVIDAFTLLEVEDLGPDPVP